MLEEKLRCEDCPFKDKCKGDADRINDTLSDIVVAMLGSCGPNKWDEPDAEINCNIQMPTEALANIGRFHEAIEKLGIPIPLQKLETMIFSKFLKNGIKQAMRQLADRNQGEFKTTSDLISDRLDKLHEIWEDCDDDG